VLEAIYALASKKHPYAWTPAGTIADLDRVTRADCQSFYDEYYLPNNATLIVVGDADRARVEAAAKKHFGPIPRGPAPPPVEVVEPPQRQPREQLADWPSQLSVVLGAYRIPSARHADLPALRVLNAILAMGRSSRLHQALVRRDKVALQAGGFIWPREHPGLLFVYAVGLPAHKVAPMKRALLAEIARLANGGVTTEELSKARNQLTTRHLAQMKTLGGVARAIGQATYLLGDPGAFVDEVGRIDGVSAAQVKEAARRYLRGDALNLVLLPGGRTKGGGR
jgi:zinc protease